MTNNTVSLPQTDNQVTLEEKKIKRGVDITWKNVTYTAHTKKYHREILKGLSGICKQGEMTAIMGSSGAGKTTLLNILCCRAENTNEVKLSGEITANGQSFDARSFSNFAAYVMQEDLIMETMTVLEALQFAANLKMKGSNEEKQAKVKEVLKIMRLEKCQHTLIGGQKIKGVTKGEKKRTSIAFELVSDPDVIFLDEPTSGLDSFTAYNVVDVLQQYAKEQNKTIICTIHQPSSEIFQKFDRLILLVDGKFIYQGPRSKVIKHFGSFGFQCPQLSNPADYFMSIMHAESEENRNNYKTYFEHFDTDLRPQIDQEIAQHGTEIIAHKSSQAPFMTELKILIDRNLKNMKRNPMELKAKIMQSLILGIFVGIVYLNLPDPANHVDDQRAVMDYNGAIFFLIINTNMNTLFPIVLSFPLEKAVFLKEENAKLYSIGAYLLAKSIVESILSFICPVIFIAISYYMIGLNANFGRFCFFILVNILSSFVGQSQGMFFGSLFKDAHTAIGVTPMMVLPFMLFGGFYKNVDDMPDWNAWIQWLSPYRYAFEASVRSNYVGTPFTIDVVGQTNLNLGKWMCMLLLLILFLAYLILTYLLLKFKKQRLQ
ncbi:ABC-2 family transporter protein (macronuclear) [Tetrahymena thermophila SB210]|uniref:ABC-2 family transporter protein n=1 Tax=Tetrahymena thermophila (strain SB210) TaxID=312017 RepID=Q22MJ0_TETTS|nr:ABC-2 family transporter protein [Tetrahymena thermophila SB210]EAR86501.1 ABC-2 family transporter protein [Tetrahymena thermophila SB210]|eukprot:XP_977030.1 ABC-2 family transporter protein [Tetrahymena thermophila SB210]